MVHVLLGGTGTLGNALADLLLAKTEDRVRVMARGEHRLMEMQRRLHNDRLSFFVGDVRDRQRLRRALSGATYVYHMAALKHVHTCDYDVIEAVRTNIEGTANVIDACIEAGVHKAVLVSTDKAVEPTTTYGATKMVAEKLFINGNSYSPQGTAFYCVRYGNVLASQGSVITIWQQQMAAGQPITVADPATTRFWWRPEDAAEFVYQSMDKANAGDIFVPLMASCSLSELADIVAPNLERIHCETYSTEKVHEVLLFPHEVPLGTHVAGMRAIRVAYLKPVAEDPMGPTQLCSADMRMSSIVASMIGG